MSEPASTPSAVGATGVGGIVAQGRALWAKLPARARTAALATTAGIVALVAYLVLQGGGGSWSSVVPGLTQSDALELISALNERDIPSRLKPGSVVQVPTKRLVEARAAAVVTGVPRSKTGLEALNKAVFGMSSEQERQRYQIALQNDLEHKIQTFGPISGASVSLQFGKASVFKDAGTPATASVQVRLKPGQTLAPQQVRGIKLLVAGAVPGLDLDHVYAMDQDANPLVTDDARAGDAQHQLEGRLADDVRKMLENVVGVGKVKAVVQVELDHRTVNKTEETLTQPQTLSTQKTTVGAATAPTTAGVTGVQGTLGGTPATPAPPVATSGGTTNETINYTNGRTIVQSADPGDSVARIHLAVLVDEKLDENGEVVPRSAEELASLKQLAHTAAGLVDARGDELTFQSIAFAPPVETPPAPVVAKPKLLPVPLPIAALGGAAVIAIIAFVLLRRRKAARPELGTARIALPAPVAELERVLSPTLPHGDDAATPPALPPGRSLEERVLGAVRADVTRASRVLAGWLHEPDPGAHHAHLNAANAAANAAASASTNANAKSARP